MKTLLIVLSLAGCSSVPINQLSDLTPAECRAYGVDVADKNMITGTIVRSEFGFSRALDRECSPGSAAISGCAKPIGREDVSWRSPTREYEIWYSNTKCVPEHEACHALYERAMHTVQFDLRTYMGDTFAACPRNETGPQLRTTYRGLEGFGREVL